MADVIEEQDAAAQIHIMRTALETIRDVAAVSEGVEFYAMIAGNALKEADG